MHRFQSRHFIRSLGRVCISRFFEDRIGFRDLLMFWRPMLTSCTLARSKNKEDRWKISEIRKIDLSRPSLGVPSRRSVRSLILLELVIALGLVAILLSVLFRFFAGSVQMDHKIEEARAKLYEREHFQTRLNTLFTSITPRSNGASQSSSSFYTLDEKTPGLMAVFDNGIDPDPAFSGPIIGQLFLDEQHNLTLATWPLEKEKNNIYRKEILLPHVENIRFQFLAKKNVQHIDPQAIPITAGLEWRTNWPKHRWDIPSIIRVIIQQNKQEIPFAFSLPLIEPIVTYQEAGDNE